MLKDNEYYIKNKSSIKITKVTLWYGFSESLGIYQGHKKLHETYTGNSTTSDSKKVKTIVNIVIFFEITKYILK